MTILVVDDSAFTRRSLIQDLPDGLRPCVVEAGDGVAALEAFVRDEPCLLFLDVSMPRMSGLEVLAELSRKSHAACVVVVTSEPDPEVEERAKAMGAHAVLRKPWKRIDITRAVADAGLG